MDFEPWCQESQDTDSDGVEGNKELTVGRWELVQKCKKHRYVLYTKDEMDGSSVKEDGYSPSLDVAFSIDCVAKPTDRSGLSSRPIDE